MEVFLAINFPLSCIPYISACCIFIYHRTFSNFLCDFFLDPPVIQEYPYICEFLKYPFLMISNFIQLWLENILYIISVLLNLLWFVSQPKIWSVLENSFVRLRSIQMGGVFCRCLLGLVGLQCYSCLLTPCRHSAQLYCKLL